jgi:hypothetical protein
MPLPGSGFLAIWNDTTPEGDAEWRLWHTSEHIPERVGVPGFLAGRRYIDPSRTRERYFTLYPGESVATFSSGAYRARLDNPTPWTLRTAPHFKNFLRGACRTLASTGLGVGGAIATLRLTVTDDSRLERSSPGLCRRLIEDSTFRGLAGAHVGRCDAAITGVPTRERAARGNLTEPVFDAVLLVEGEARRPLEAALASISRAVAAADAGVTIGECGVYDLEICLEKHHLPR